MLEKLTDYMIAVMLSFALVVSMFFEPVMSNFADMQDSKKEISQLSSQLKSMESELRNSGDTILNYLTADVFDCSLG